MCTMSNRLTQIATRTGDDGSTGLGDGTRVRKDHLRVQAMGDVDELNSQLGVLRAERLPDDVRELLVVIQQELFNLGGELSIPGYELLKAQAVLRLDEALAHYNATLPRLKEFILPAGTRSAALAHVGRTIARRAERTVVALGAVEAVRAELARVAREGLGPDELEQTKRQVKGQIMLSLESTGARLYRLAGFALYEEPFLDLDDLLARIDAVTADDVAAAAATYYDPERQLLVRLGPEGE
jgi:cob(I)alamin adenosyltransferase